MKPSKNLMRIMVILFGAPPLLYHLYFGNWLLTAVVTVSLGMMLVLIGFKK
ncbi:hypothetical protein MKX50_24705 [Paenibacillus sp. FSL W8-0186]|uniref:Uncharacterized protein n=1 Tax=Paenibacillus woosongensis TaxID=307580 RepID=A0A7X2Z554_9BACL|nr:hypothetical protein [Paenibacillus woosongensis]MUG47707.1 hypothetical protein [Paenibacillus woosongensis]